MLNKIRISSMNSVYFYFLFIFAIQTSRATSQNKHSYFQIDEFIKQLMTSEKFDELANVIADKAAQKIITIENHTTNNSSKSISRQGNRKEDSRSEEKSNNEHGKNRGKDFTSNDKPNYNEEKLKRKSSRSEEKSNYDHEKKSKSNSRFSVQKSNSNNVNNKMTDSRSEEKANFDRDKKTDSRSDEKANNDREKSDSYAQGNEKKNRQGNYGKIDTQAFLKNHIASRELELNFKRLTGGSENKRDEEKENNSNMQKEFDNDKDSNYNENNRAVDNHEDELDNNENNSNEKNEGSTETKLSEDSANNEHEQATFHETKDKNKDVSNSKEKKSPDNADSAENTHKEFKYNAENPNEKPVPRIQVGSSSKENIKPIDANEHDTFQTVKEGIRKVIEVFQSPTFFSSENVGVGVLRARSEENTLSIPIHYRKENKKEKGKPLETSSEYADYNDNLAKQTTTKYINTYIYIACFYYIGL